MGKLMVYRCKLISFSFMMVTVLLAILACAFGTTKLVVSTISGILCFVSCIISFVSWSISQRLPADSHSIRTLVTQYFIFAFLTRRGRRALERLGAISKQVSKVQAGLLRGILQRNQNTVFGLKHGFSRIGSRRDFICTVPLSTYSDYSSYISVMLDDNDSTTPQLTTDPVIYLATSSGTTGVNKQLPVTWVTKHTASNHIAPMMYHVTDMTVGLCLQRVLALSYAVPLRTAKSGLHIGPVSSHIKRYVPFVITPRVVESECTNERAALHLHAVFGLAEREIGHMEAMMSTVVYSFWRYIEHNWIAVCGDLASGTLTSVESLDLPSHVITSVTAEMRADPKRSAELGAIFRDGFTGIARRIWPNLRSVRMVTTGAFAHHAKILATHYMKGVCQLSFIHAATEGFFGFNTSRDQHVQVYTLLPEFGFFEFIPEKEIHDEHPNTVFAEQVLAGNLYEIVCTSHTGLYRYRTGDVIKIVEFFNECPVYEFQYRLGQMLNLYWEKTPESVFYQAVERTTRNWPDITLTNYTATEDMFVQLPDDKDSSTKCYVLFVEVLCNGGDFKLTESQKAAFDDNLRAIFELYETLRETGSIGRMRVIQVKCGTFESMRFKMAAATAKSEQYKLPRVLRDRHSIDFLLLERLH